MTPKFKNGWCSNMPQHMRGKSALLLCMLPEVKSSGSSPGNAHVYLNVYDLTPINGLIYWAGVGVFHTGVQVHGVEYAFGAHDESTSGVFEIEPRQCPGFRFRKSIFMGTTHLDSTEIRGFMKRQSVNYSGDSYHLVAKNCNHFSEHMCYKLTGNHIPKWVRSATAYFRRPSKYLLSDQEQTLKAVIARKRDSEALSAACHQSQCIRGNKKYQYLLCSYIPTTKAAYHPGN